MSLIVYHFAGMEDRAQKIIKYSYKYFIDFHADKNNVEDFNKNATLIYAKTEGYDKANILESYINENNINAFNIYENVKEADNIEKIYYLKKLLDEKYDLLNEYLLFIDSGDTILNINIPFNQILNFFNSYNCKVLFDKDENDFPYYMEELWRGTEGYIEDYFKQKNIENLDKNENKHYLNSGVYFGKKEDIRELINLCYCIIKLNKQKKYKSDQFIFKLSANKINHNHNYHFVEVDYNNKLFVCESLDEITLYERYEKYKISS